MRVAIVNTTYSGGGAERVARELYHDLLAHGDQASMFVARRQPAFPQGVQSLRLPGERFLRVFERLGTIRDWRHIGSRLRLRTFPRRFDVVNLHNIHSGYVSLKAINAVCRRMPVVWSLHDEFAINDGLPGDLGPIMTNEQIIAAWGSLRFLVSTDPDWTQYRAFVRQWMPTPAALVCYSEHIMRLLEKSQRWAHVPRYLVRISVPMADLESAHADRQQCKTALGFRPEDKVVLMVASHFSVAYKGINFGADALAKLPADQFKCLLVGRGAEEAAARLPQKCICTGALQDGDALARAYRAADVTLVPSVVESFGLVAAESLACETPVAAFRIGGLVELLGENQRGLLAPPVDCDALAKNVSTLLASPELRLQMGSTGRQWILENCNSQQSVTQMLKIFKNAIDAHATGQLQQAEVLSSSH